MSIRAFVAIEMPPEIKGGLQTTIADLRQSFDGLPVRWVPVDSIHLTLKFLGDIPSERVNAISEALVAQTKNISPFDVALSGIGVFPNASKPNVLWIGLDANDQLQKLQEQAEAALNPLGYKPETRSFSPHLTLARVRRDANYSQLRRIGEFAALAKPTNSAVGKVNGIVLFSSELKPSGAVYNALSHSPLAGKN